MHPFDAVFVFAPKELREGHCRLHVCGYAFSDFLVVAGSALLLYRLAAQQMALARAAAKKLAAAANIKRHSK